MSEKITLTKEAYLEHVIYGKANHADKCRLFGKNAVNDFVNANQAWIQEQWDAKRKPTPKFVHPVKHEGKVPGKTGRPSEPMTPEKKAQFRERMLQGWNVTKMWRALAAGEIEFETVKAEADAGNVIAKIACRAIEELSAVTGEPMSVPLFKEFLARVDGPVVEQTQAETRITVVREE